MRRIRAILVLVVALVFSCSTVAFAFDVAATIQAIDEVTATHGLSADQAALYKAYALFDKQNLPARFAQGTKRDPRWFCATPQIIKLNNHMD